MKTSRLHTALVLGRVSNLPTVWSNLLAGWILGGGGMELFRPALLLAGGSFLYVGGMYLNDFCDAAFDAQYCPQRPIPVGAISRPLVGRLALGWFVAGGTCLAFLGRDSAAIGGLLLLAIVLYDFRHKGVSWAPLVMAACRFLLYILGAVSATGARHVFIYPAQISVALAASALAAYVAGITYLARGESRPGKPARWALLLLLLPIALGFSTLSPGALGTSGLLLIWLAWLILPLVRKTSPSIGRVVSALLAGIVLVDLIAVVPLLGFAAGGFLVLFFLALLLQRVVPAT